MGFGSMIVDLYEAKLKRIIQGKLRSKMIECIEGDDSSVTFAYKDRADGKTILKIKGWEIDLGLSDVVKYCDIPIEQFRKYQIFMLKQCRLSLSPFAKDCIARGIPEIGENESIKGMPAEVAEWLFKADDDEDDPEFLEFCDKLSDFWEMRVFLELPTHKSEADKSIRTRLADAFGKRIMSV